MHINRITGSNNNKKLKKTKDEKEKRAYRHKEHELI